MRTVIDDGDEPRPEPGAAVYISTNSGSWSHIGHVSGPVNVTSTAGGGEPVTLGQAHGIWFEVPAHEDEHLHWPTDPYRTVAWVDKRPELEAGPDAG
jgi:hypothetical protein